MNLIAKCWCPHPSEMHTLDLGCVLCDCTTGRAAPAAPDQLEPGSVVWHRHREQPARFLGDPGLDADSGIVDFSPAGGDEQRVSLSQLQLVMNPREAASWADTFAAMRKLGLGHIDWNDDQPPTGPQHQAINYLAQEQGFSLVTWEPFVSEQRTEWRLNAHDLKKGADRA